MSKTISFVAREELAEWLELRADEEMKTVSSVVQDIVAEQYYRQEQGETTTEDDHPSTPLDQPPFSDHPEAWYIPSNPAKKVAVRVPEDKDYADDRRYYKTYDNAAKRIRSWYE